MSSSLRTGPDADRGDGGLGRGGQQLGGDLFEQGPHGRFRIAGGIELELEQQPAVQLASGDDQVELAGGDGGVHRLVVEVGEAVGRGPVNHVQHDLEQRRPIRAPGGFQAADDQVERDVGVGVGPERAVAGPLQPLAPGRVAAGVDADRHDVEEQPDQVLGLRRFPPGDRHPDHQVALSGTPREHSRQTGQQRHE